MTRAKSQNKSNEANKKLTRYGEETDWVPLPPPPPPPPRFVRSNGKEKFCQESATLSPPPPLASIAFFIDDTESTYSSDEVSSLGILTIVSDSSSNTHKGANTIISRMDASISSSKKRAVLRGAETKLKQRVRSLCNGGQTADHAVTSKLDTTICVPSCQNEGKRSRSSSPSSLSSKKTVTSRSTASHNPSVLRRKASLRKKELEFRRQISRVLSQTVSDDPAKLFDRVSAGSRTASSSEKLTGGEQRGRGSWKWKLPENDDEGPMFAGSSPCPTLIPSPPPSPESGDAVVQKRGRTTTRFPKEVPEELNLGPTVVKKRNKNKKRKERRRRTTPEGLRSRSKEPSIECTLSEEARAVLLRMRAREQRKTAAKTMNSVNGGTEQPMLPKRNDDPELANQFRKWMTLRLH